jgi:hypothetical protein
LETTPGGKRNKPASLPIDGAQYAVNFLRGYLALHPVPASHVEELAVKKGIGSRQLERAREILNVRVERLDNGRGICYFLPSQTDANAAED